MNVLPLPHRLTLPLSDVLEDVELRLLFVQGVVLAGLVAGMGLLP